MRDIEIIKWLENLKPETSEQKRKIYRCIDQFSKDGLVSDFLVDYEFDDVNNVPVDELYENYKSWCDDNDIDYTSKIGFSRMVCVKYNVEVVVENKQRIYRWG